MPIEHIDIFSRDQAIAAIEATYPADSWHPLRSRIGSDLLTQAIKEQTVNRWRLETDAVLFRYAELCVAEFERREKAAERARELGL